MHPEIIQILERFGSGPAGMRALREWYQQRALTNGVELTPEDLEGLVARDLQEFSLQGGQAPVAPEQEGQGECERPGSSR